MTHQAILPPERATIVGVLNVTPDSFSDGGRWVGATGASDAAAARERVEPVEPVERVDVGAVVDEAARLVEAGAHWLDVGGESTRPGAETVDPDRECARVVPVIEALAGRFDAVISIDTRKSAVAEPALAAGARVVNDVSGGRHDPALAAVAARAGAGLVLGHIRGTPADMQRAPHYDDVLPEVADELSAAVEQARAAGVARERLAIDPGIGFGKRLEDNLALLAHLDWLRNRMSLPVMVGVSRKSFLGTLTGDPVEARDLASHCAEAVAIFAGADAVRVHDVDGARRAAAVGAALRGARRKELR